MALAGHCSILVRSSRTGNNLPSQPTRIKNTGQQKTLSSEPLRTSSQISFHQSDVSAPGSLQPHACIDAF